MRRIILLAVVVIGSVMLACQDASFLDDTQTTNLNEGTVFADSTYATQFFFGIYEDIGFDSDPGRFSDGNLIFPARSGGLDGGSDESEARAIPTITTNVQFATGTVNTAIVSKDAWEICYKNIRKVNQFLKHLDITPFQPALRTQLASEARFLRAWYYGILVKHYGGIRLIGDTVYTASDTIRATRNTYAECVDYIVSECDAAAANLLTRPVARDHGRIGAGACKALKARVLLYAASPLFNGSRFAPEPLTAIVGYPEADLNRWKIAADAAQAVITLNAYQLHVNNSPPGDGFYEEFVAKDFQGKNAYSGSILERVATDGNYEERLWQPPSRGGGQGGAYPYHDLVNAFGMANGKAITDPTSGYDPQNPYAGRDPRLRNSINYDQSRMPAAIQGPPVPIDIFIGSYEGRLSGQDAVRAGTPTGYYVNKMLHRNVIASGFIEGPASRPLMRYAEVLLNFAEAKNEFDGPTSEVYAAVEAIRERAGLSPFTLAAGLSKDAMREVIRNERRVELAFEGHRFFDVRRWMIADETENRMMTGMEVVRTDTTASYNVFNVRKHNFRKAMYLWPIPYSETAKSPELLQNPYY
jgi:starch-binding outer membrane protein, SusD/RagB family